MAVEVRPAAEGDVPFVAWVMQAAARSHLDRSVWEYMLDVDEQRAIDFLASLAVTDAVHLQHHSLFLIAEVDGEPAAAMCAYDLDTQSSSALMPVLPEVAEAHGIAMDDDLLRRAAVFSSGLVQEWYGPPGRRLVIENVATAPAFRGRGLCDLLLGEWRDRGVERGYPAMQVGVFIGNESARRAYLRAGYALVAEATSPAWEEEIGCPGTELLVQEL
jgi:ribosomal protein S18 acetylase RimI-like enzyme